MATFRGKTNLILGPNDGEEQPWVRAEQDPESRDFIVDVKGEDLKKFRPLAEQYGFVEDKSSSSSDS